MVVRSGQVGKGTGDDAVGEGGHREGRGHGSGGPRDESGVDDIEAGTVDELTVRVGGSAEDCAAQGMRGEDRGDGVDVYA